MNSRRSTEHMVITENSIDLVKETLTKIPTMNRDELVNLQNAVIRPQLDKIKEEIGKAQVNVINNKTYTEPVYWQALQTSRRNWGRIDQAVMSRLGHLKKIEHTTYKSSEKEVMRRFVEIACDDLSPHDFREMALEAGFTHELIVDLEKNRVPE